MKVAIATGDFVPTAIHQDGTKILGGSGYARLGQYQPHSNLGAIIGELTWHPDKKEFGVRDWYGIEHWDFDIVIMQRWMHHTIPERIRIVQKKGVVVLNDIDDWYWGLSTENRAFWESHPKRNPNENINHYRKTLAASSGVIVSTPYLAQRLSEWVRPNQIKVFLNHVDLTNFKLWKHTESEKPVIGWVGSTGHRSGDLKILKNVYAHTKEKFGYHHSGHIGWYNAFHDQVGLGKDEVTILLPVPPERLGQLMRFDIGVVPLHMSPFNQAKSWMKGLEYAAAGIPFVASPSDEYLTLKKVYGIGRLAKGTHQWMKHLNQLRDPQLRKNEAAKNIQKIKEANLNVEAGAKLWDEIVLSFT